jgi:hypothetical protein
MYGEQVEIYLPSIDKSISVFVTCTTSTPDKDKKERALRVIVRDVWQQLNELKGLS